jgi:hypothetical protein
MNVAQPWSARGRWRCNMNEKRPKAADMAGHIIDQQADQSALPDEQESRKRELLKGPKEFRDLRRDHPAKKR